MPNKRKLPLPYSQSNTMATNAFDDSNLQKKRDYAELPADQQELLTLQTQKKGPKNLSALIAGALATTAAMIPAGEITSPLTPILESYNPNTQGYGSSAIAKNGMKVRKFFTGGDPTEGDKGKKKAATPYQAPAAPSGYKPSTSQQRTNWNQFLDYLNKEGVGGSTELDKRDKSMGLEYLNKYNKANPNATVDPNFVPIAQYESHLIRKQDSFPGLDPERAKYAFASLSPQYKERPISEVDSWLGSYTSKQYYPQFERASKDGKQTFGTDFETYSQTGLDMTKKTDLLQNNKMVAYAPKQQELKNGGKVKQLSNNPHDGGTIEFKGPSHENGGIALTPTIEVEGDETAARDPEGNLTIFGNMKVPGSNKRFKDVVKEIGDMEKRIEKKTRSPKDAFLDDRHPVDQLKQNSLKLMEQGGNLKLAELSRQKQMLANIQDAILQASEKRGLDPEALASGKIKAKKGLKVKLSGDGDDPKTKKPSMAERHNNPGNIKFGKFAQRYGAVKGEPATDGGHFAKFPDKGVGLKALRGLLETDGYKNLSVKEAVKRWTNNADYSVDYEDIAGKKVSELSRKEKLQLYNTITAGEDGKYYTQKEADVPGPTTPVEINTQKTPIDTGKAAPPRQAIQLAPGIPGGDTPFEKTATPGTPLLGDLTPATGPKTSIADMNPFNALQVLPEIVGVINNKLEPVQAQRYSPDLFSPYQISLQDKLNENQATFNTLARSAQYNPGSLGTLAAQKYSADSSVLGDEFRANQGIANEVTNKNVGILNDAQMKNLGIADQQMVRQSQARSNTKAQNMEALGSVSAKFLQHNLENLTARMYEPLFDYRPTQDENGKITGLGYAGAPVELGGGSANPAPDVPVQPYEATRRDYDGKGNIKRVSVATPALFDVFAKPSKQMGFRPFSGKKG